MIQQLGIAATQRYNLPYQNIETALPKRFVDLSLHSLNHINDPNFQLNQHLLQYRGCSQQGVEIRPRQIRSFPLQPKTEETVVTAIDTSWIKIGETQIGTLIAIRGAYVWREARKFRYLRFGPLIFHISEENIKSLLSSMHEVHSATSPTHEWQTSSSSWHIPMRLTSVFERTLQFILCKNMTNSIILFDGSLASSLTMESAQPMKETLSVARKGGNVVLALSKTTTLHLDGCFTTKALAADLAPCLFKIDGVKSKPPLELLGQVYVARLAKRGYSFRLDIDREVPINHAIEATERLLGNDLLPQSYPETLRLAHILCTFTANEVLGMQHYVVHKCNLRISTKPDIHRLLFGVFGKGED